VILLFLCKKAHVKIMLVNDIIDNKDCDDIKKNINFLSDPIKLVRSRTVIYCISQLDVIAVYYVTYILYIHTL